MNIWYTGIGIRYTGIGIWYAGIGSDMADKLDNMSSSEVWSIQGDKITLTLVNPNRTVTNTFKLGENVVEQTGSKGNYTVSNNLVIWNYTLLLSEHALIIVQK